MQQLLGTAQKWVSKRKSEIQDGGSHNKVTRIHVSTVVAHKITTATTIILGVKQNGDNNAHTAGGCLGKWEIKDSSHLMKVDME